MWSNLFSHYFASGDLPFFWKEQTQTLSWLPQVFQEGQGFGFNGLLSLWLDYPFGLLVKLLSIFGLSWFVIEKLLWLSVFALAILSSYQLVKHVLGNTIFNYFTPIIYVANTYFFLLFSGGQLGVAWAYAFAPWVLHKFIEIIDAQKKYEFRSAVITGLFFALLIAFDLRIAYLILGAVALYSVLRYKVYASLTIITAVFVAASLHLYWILPTVLASRGVASLGEQFTDPDMLKFLSFADFSHALSLLHPNWPENLFGKVYFLQPEFLIIPILAFTSLLLLKAKTDKRSQIIFFALLALIGAFFAKGVNEPFGQLFHWMFVHIPGFVMFRDPTKFYLYVAIGYSVLIPITLKKYKYFGIIFVIFWLCTLRGFSIQPVQLPQEYIELKNMLVADRTPSRTLWIPAKENFAYYSDIHPVLAATNAASIDPSVKYVIVPIDVNKRIFLNDYIYDRSMREQLIAGIRLPRDGRFHTLAVFENPEFNGMQTVIPQAVVKQQQLANIGLGISVVFLIVWIFLH